MKTLRKNRIHSRVSSGGRRAVSLLYCCFCVSILALGLGSAEALEDSAAEGLQELNGWALDDALKAICLSRKDVSVRKVRPADDLELTAVVELLDRPLRAPEYALRLAGRLRQRAGRPSQMLDVIVEELNVQPCSTTVVAGGEVDVKSKAGTDPGALRDDSADKAQGRHDPISGKQLDIGHMVTRMLKTPVARSRRLLCEAFEHLTEKEVKYLEKHLPSLYLEQPAEGDIVRRYRREKKQREEAKRLLATVRKVDMTKLFAAARVLAEGVESVLEVLQTGHKAVDTWSERRSNGRPEVLVVGDLGTWVVGSFGDDVYDQRYDVIIDPGGDDTYLGEAGGARPGKPVSVIVDLAGNDTYRTEESFSLAGAQMGISILVDCGGDDIYEAKHSALGCGLLGVALLLDEAGDDEYIADTGAQGAGAFGIGVLSDMAGDDRYSAALCSQGFASTLGFGALLDTVGDDIYFAGEKYVDRLRPGDHYRSFSQGFGLGIRPVAPGGIGVLVDGNGDDNYIADLFAQGSSYWYALGVLVDSDGNDHYLAHRYAQGAAVHQSVAVCIDERGDDGYFSESVSMGCGHDLAVGVAVDLSGNDRYRIGSSGLGAGIANGVGIHVDASGRDSYVVEERTCLGSGTPARDFDSIGVKLDLQGEDTYSLKGNDGMLWTAEGSGVGYDASQ